MMKLTTLYVFILILEIAPTKQKLHFSRSGEVASVSSFRTVYKISLGNCRKECTARPSCASLNYFRSSHKCEMNKMDTGVWSVAEKTGSVYSKKADWTDDNFEHCSCVHGRKCVVTHEGHECIVEECDRLPTQTSSNMNNVGARVNIHVQCLKDTKGLITFGAGGRPDTTRATMTCGPDGTWKMKKPSGGRCLAVAFVMAPGTGQDPYHEWMHGTSSRSDVTWNQYYRNGVIDEWLILSISHIRFSIFKDRQEVKYIVFNGTGSTSLDWFAQSRVIESSWNDISSAEYNIFIISGHSVDQIFSRRFFMNKMYASCPGDVGWFMVTVLGVCPWEQGTFPVFVYSRSSGAGLLATESEQADYVYIVLYLDTAL